jgi:hypothetical protein
LIDSLVVDANPLLSALLGGRPLTFCSRTPPFCSPQNTLFEVERYLPFVARELGRAELDLFREFELFPVMAVQPHVYDSELNRATQLIGPRIRRTFPCWRWPSACVAHLDRGSRFENLPGVTVFDGKSFGIGWPLTDKGQSRRRACGGRPRGAFGRCPLRSHDYEVVRRRDDRSGATCAACRSRIRG